MTLRVTIGEIYKGNESDALTVQPCPSTEKNMVKSKHTTHPNEAIRDGSDLWLFFRVPPLITIFKAFNGGKSPGEYPVTIPLQKIAKDIAAIQIDFEDEIDRDRLRWLKYWTAKAVKLFGERAGIEFS